MLVFGVSVVLPHCKDVTVICATVTVSVIGLLDPLRTAVIVADWFDVTAAAVAVKVAVVAPAATAAQSGTVRAAFELLDSATWVPPVGAAFEIVTVHVVVEDGAGVVLPHCKDVTVICVVTVSVIGWLDPLRTAVIVAFWLLLIVAVLAVNVAVVAPAPTVTEAGTVTTSRRLLVNVTTAPPVGAAFKVTVHVVVEECSRLSADALQRGHRDLRRHRQLNVAGSTPLCAAVIVAFWLQLSCRGGRERRCRRPCRNCHRSRHSHNVRRTARQRHAVPPVGAAFEMLRYRLAGRRCRRRAAALHRLNVDLAS